MAREVLSRVLLLSFKAQAGFAGRLSGEGEQPNAMQPFAAALILQPIVQVFAMIIVCACNGQEVELDQAGFLIDQNEWNEDVAAALAAKEGIDALSEEQMDLVRFTREYFLKHRKFPLVNTVCWINPQADQCADEPCMAPEKAWLIAGLSQQDGVSLLCRCGRRTGVESSAVGA